MRWFWITFWIILVVLQLMPGETRRFWMRNEAGGSSLRDNGLLILARQTNGVWEERQAQPEEERSTGTLPDTAELILELSKIEMELAEMDIDIKLAEDLERWFLVESRKVTHADKQSYIFGITDWLEPFLKDQASLQVLDRMRLEPCQDSSYPELHFELNGSPMTMGALLLTASDPQGLWRLTQMELIHDEDQKDWWMLGSCSYEPFAQ